jgi:hypothetical protein
MILGIVSCALFCIWWLSLPSAVVGLVLSILGKNKAKQQGTATGMATAGMILSIIALGLAIVIMIAALAGFAMFSHAMQNVHQ